MNDKELRDKLNLYILNTGLKAKFLANKLGINESIFSKYRKGYKQLYPEQLDAIRIYLDNAI